VARNGANGAKHKGIPGPYLGTLTAKIHYMSNVFAPGNLHQIKSAQTRSRLLNAAEEILLSKGPGQLSLHEVARVAHMTTGAVQHHFGSKAALMMDVVAHLVTKLGETTDFWPPAHWPQTQRAEHFVTQAWEQLYGQPRFAVAWSAYLAVRDDPVLTEHIQARRAELSETLIPRMGASFPELAAQKDGSARMQFILSALRGLGLLTPFTHACVIEPQLRVLSDTLLLFLNHNETTP
jgi:AcrR family transcriptional regulator